MAIAYESESSSSSNTVSVPSGTVAGDLLVGAIGSGAAELVAPAGWTTIDSFEHYPAGSDWVWVGYIVVSGTPPASYTWTGGGGTTRAVIQRFSGVDSFGGFAAQSNLASSTLTCPNVTPNVSGSLVVFYGGGFYVNTPSTPVGYSNFHLSGGTSGVPELMLGSLVQGSAASTGSVNSMGWASYAGLTQRGVHMWFRPVGSGSTVPVFVNHYRQQGMMA